MQITFTIADAIASRIIDALALRHGWTETIIDPDTGEPIPNPITKGAWAKRYIIYFIKEEVKLYEATAAAQIAYDEAAQAVDDEIEIA